MNTHFLYAGFWKRFAAYLLDQIILGFVRMIIFVPIIFIILAKYISENDYEQIEKYSNASYQHFTNDFSLAAFSVVIVYILIFILISIATDWLYYAFMESSKKQATFGKIILGIKVADMEGNRISFARASGRYFSKIISGLFFGIGYIMAAFTEKKQALHDIIAGCIIIESIEYVNPDIQI